MSVKREKRRQTVMSAKAAEYHQVNIFGDGICTVCGKDVAPTVYAGKQSVLIWCSVECTRLYAAKWMTDKQAVFVEEYLVDLNATQAAIRAGYSKASATAIGVENLAKPIIQQAIGLAMAARSERVRITVDEVLTDIELIKQDAMKQANGQMINHTSALRACELQGRHLQMFIDKVEVEVMDNLAERLQRARLAKQSNQLMEA